MVINYKSDLGDHNIFHYRSKQFFIITEFIYVPTKQKATILVFLALSGSPAPSKLPTLIPAANPIP